jgi:hypothetical protein
MEVGRTLVLLEPKELTTGSSFLLSITCSKLNTARMPYYLQGAEYNLVPHPGAAHEGANTRLAL